GAAGDRRRSAAPPGRSWSRRATQWTRGRSLRLRAGRAPRHARTTGRRVVACAAHLDGASRARHDHRSRHAGRPDEARSSARYAARRVAAVAGARCAVVAEWSPGRSRGGSARGSAHAPQCGGGRAARTVRSLAWRGCDTSAGGTLLADPLRVQAVREGTRSPADVEAVAHVFVDELTERCE